MGERQLHAKLRGNLAQTTCEEDDRVFNLGNAPDLLGLIAKKVHVSVSVSG